MKKILIYALILAIIAIGVLTTSLRHYRAENAVYKANQATLLDKVEYYQTENGKNVASVQKLTLSLDELKEHYDLICKTADELNIKLKRLEGASTTVANTEVHFVTEIRDSIVYRDGKLDSIVAFNWRDPWTDVQGEIVDKSVALNIESRDTLVQLIHRVPKQWWFFKWGCKAIRQEIVSTNPHTEIVYSEYIELKK